MRDDNAEIEDEEAAEAAKVVKLPQSEAILEAIIKSSKPLPIGPKEDQGYCSSAWFDRQLTLLSDRLVPWHRCRWLSFATLLAAFAFRIAEIERQFFAAYVLAIYILNQFLLFLSPATEDDDLPAGPRGAEYRPFVRALSEYRFWSRGILATAAAMLVSFFDDFDLDVDGWALALYFGLLFIYTMKQQIFHMIKYGYVPWNPPKRRRAEKDESMDV